ncbi:uncharacterized protein VP01_27g8 [Puccinia sorghi]|uniref:Enoyl-CoA hydratase n=1 Tax=Puccinia sorghi TaxID=27349 RepID=A0A0L6V2K4_9BASI|nr:uncharacterized protein VP01_27g8 [Puccinia sorghi]
MATVTPLASPTRYPTSTLTKPVEYPGVFLLLHPSWTSSGSTGLPCSACLLHRQRIQRASPGNSIVLSESSILSDFFTVIRMEDTTEPGNGLDLTEALALDHFFQHVLNPLYTKLLRFPMPTVAAINGHAFAGGFCLALAHDYRIMKENEQKGKAMMAMNELEFGAPVPVSYTSRRELLLGLIAVIEAKFPTTSAVAKCLTEAHRFGAQESLSLGIVNALAPEAEVVQRSLKLAFEKSTRASTGVFGMIKESVYREAINILNSNNGGNADVKSIHTSRLKQLSRHPSPGQAKL